MYNRRIPKQKGRKITMIKSFCNRKATIIHDGERIKLYSYDTYIMELEMGIIKKITLNKDNLTATTLRHIKEFLSIYGDSIYSDYRKKDFIKLIDEHQKIHDEKWKD